MTTKNILVHFDFMTMVNMALLILLHTLLQTHFQNNHILQACSTWGLLRPAPLLGFAQLWELFCCKIVTGLVSFGEQRAMCMRLVWCATPSSLRQSLVQALHLFLHLLYIGFTFTSIHICFTFNLTHIYFSTQVQFDPIWVPNTCFYVLNNINHEAHNQGYVELQKKNKFTMNFSWLRYLFGL